MTAAQPASNVSSSHFALRVAVLQGGRLVEERTFANCTRVSVGPGGGCDVILLEPRLRRAHVLVAMHKQRLRLTLASWMSARWAAEGKIADIACDATSKTRIILLPRQARARVCIGESTLLFQQVLVHATPKARLPVCVRRHWLGCLDHSFVAALIGVAIMQALFVAYLHSVDWPARPAWEDQPERITQIVTIYRPLPKPPSTPAVATPNLASQQPSAPRTKRLPQAAPTQTREERLAEVRERVSRMGLPMLLTTKDGASGFVADLLKSGSIDRDQEEALAHVGGLQVAMEEGPHFIDNSPSGTARVVSPRALGTSAIAIAQVGPARNERVVTTHITPESPITEAGTVPPGALSLRSKLPQIRSCYERVLKNHPELAGKLILRLVISAVGIVRSVEVDDQSLGDPSLIECIKAFATRWRFSPLPNGDVEVAFPLVFQGAS